MEKRLNKVCLPVVPHIIEGEHIWSWLDRLAARYSMTANQFLKSMNSGLVSLPNFIASDGGRDGFDWLSEWTGIERRELERMRPAVAGGSVWCRGWTAWCPTCVRNSVREIGEVFGRLEWCAHHQIVCDQHAVLFTDRCPVCTNRTVEPRPYNGRLRLFCHQCSTLVDDRIGHDFGSSLLSLTHFNRPTLLHLRAFQADLRRALASETWHGPWAFNSSTDFIEAVVHLCSAYLGPPINGRPAIAAFNGQGGVGDVVSGFAAAASILAAFNEVDLGVRYVSPFPTLNTRPFQFDVLLEHIGFPEQVWLASERSDQEDRLSKKILAVTSHIVPRSIYTGIAINPKGAAMRLSAESWRFAKSRKRPRLGVDGNCASTPHIERLMQQIMVDFATKRQRWFEHIGGEGFADGSLKDFESIVSLIIKDSIHALAGRSLTSALSRVMETEMETQCAGADRSFPNPKEIVKFLSGRKRRLALVALVRDCISKALFRSDNSDREQATDAHIW